MAGIVHSSVESYTDGTIAVIPDECAVENVHRAHRPACFRTYPDGETRACIYWQACVETGMAQNRQHPSAIRQVMMARGARIHRCGTICLRARANRPEGC